eukprot:scaffold32664_cov69-Phaeocystis_antarctica.AAC.2
MARRVVELYLGACAVRVRHVLPQRTTTHYYYYYLPQRLELEEGVVDVRDELVALVQDDPRLHAAAACHIIAARHRPAAIAAALPAIPHIAGLRRLHRLRHRDVPATVGGGGCNRRWRRLQP